METAINLASLIMSVIALVIAIVAIILVLAMKWSTHKIEFKPLETKSVFQEFEEEEEFQSFTEPDDKLVEEAIRLSREGKKKKKEEDPLDEILEANNFSGRY